MTNQSTIDKLIEMRLTTMADAFRNQLAGPEFREVPFEDRFGIQCKFYNVTRHCRILRSIKSVWHRDNNGMQKNS